MVRVSEVPTRLVWPSNDRTAHTLDQEVPVNDHARPSIDQVKTVNPILQVTLAPSIPAAIPSRIQSKRHKPVVEEGGMLTALDKATVRMIKNAPKELEHAGAEERLGVVKGKLEMVKRRTQDRQGGSSAVPRA